MLLYIILILVSLHLMVLKFTAAVDTRGSHWPFWLLRSGSLWADLAFPFPLEDGSRFATQTVLQHM